MSCMEVLLFSSGCYHSRMQQTKEFTCNPTYTLLTILTTSSNVLLSVVGILICFFPAGKIVAFYRHISTPNLWLCVSYNMQKSLPHLISVKKVIMIAWQFKLFCCMLGDIFRAIPFQYEDECMWRDLLFPHHHHHPMPCERKWKYWRQKIPPHPHRNRHGKLILMLRKKT